MHLFYFILFYFYVNQCRYVILNAVKDVLKVVKSITRPVLKVLSSEMDQAESRLIRWALLKGNVASVFLKNSPVPH